MNENTQLDNSSDFNPEGRGGINRVGLQYEEDNEDDLQGITCWTFVGLILVWVFTIIVKIY